MARALDRTHNGRPARIAFSGYVAVWEPDHPYAHEGWVWEHRLVAEQSLGRRLGPAEQVHHINRDKTDNRPENLLVLRIGEHSSITAFDNWADLRWLKSKLRRYQDLYGDLPNE